MAEQNINLDFRRNSSIRPYLCGPIWQCTDEECVYWRERVKEAFPHALDPMRRDYRNVELENAAEIVILDKLDVRNCDCVVVNYTKPSTGTSMEIFYAWELGKPIIVWCSNGEKLSPWILYHCTSVVYSFDDLLKKIDEYFI